VIRRDFGELYNVRVHMIVGKKEKERERTVSYEFGLYMVISALD
jgi:hypothetical protein